MQSTLVRDLKSVVLTSDALDTTAAFYRDVIGLPLEAERHKGTLRHYACQLGSVHFAIHARRGFWLEAGEPAPEPAFAPPPERAPSGATTVVSFTIVDLEAFVAHLAAQHVPIVARERIGPMTFVALRNPDGRTVCCGTPWPGA